MFDVRVYDHRNVVFYSVLAVDIGEARFIGINEHFEATGVLVTQDQTSVRIIRDRVYV